MLLHSAVISGTATILSPRTSFRCMDCSRVFTKQESLSSHMRKHQNLPNRERKYSCKVCPETFPRSSLLSRHNRTHYENRKFQCNICGKRYAGNGQLVDHLNRHNGIKTHSCEVCGKGNIKFY